MRGSLVHGACAGLMVVLFAACGEESNPRPGASAAGTTTAGAGGSGSGAGGDVTGGGGGGGDGGGGGGGGAQEMSGSVVMGVNAVNMLYIAEMRATLRVDGTVVHEEQLGGLEELVELPQEFAFEDLQDGSAVELELELHHPKYSDIGRRIARTTVVAGKTLLLRVTISDACMAWDDFTQPPSCQEPQTCIAGACRDAYVAPELLEDYSPSWASFSYCKPETPGEPVVVLGIGEKEFTPQNDMAPVQLTAGDQGGHHFWAAIRMKNLKQGSVVALSAHVPELDQDIGPYSFYREFADLPSVGYCEDVGLLFQVDTTIPLADLLGKSLVLTAEVTDDEGTSAADTKSVLLPETAPQPSP